MNTCKFQFSGADLEALPSGGLFWPDQHLYCVSDLHLGKSERHARLGGPTLPPYETQDTLNRLHADLVSTNAKTVVCLGDSFDDMAAASSLREPEYLSLSKMQAGRKWIWIEGNHDPGPVQLGGEHHVSWAAAPLTFRHIATGDAQGEVSGHYHPKVKLRNGTRRAFLVDDSRLILPAFGTYTGGLRSDDSALQKLMGPKALAILLTDPPMPVPMHRR